MANANVPTLLRAAGGLLWRNSSGEKQLAVVHRKRYDDWTLPKGKLNEGESWQHAALREVKEETNCAARLVSFAGAVDYVVNGVPKIVIYWNMITAGESRFKVTDETDLLRWLPLAEALELLSYPLEKKVVGENVQSASPMEKTTRWRRWARMRAGMSGPAERSRLEAAISRVQARLDNTSSSKRGPRSNFVLQASGFVERAEEALERGNIELGWQMMSMAERSSLYSLDRDSLRARGQALLLEAQEKLEGWRKEAVTFYLAQNGTHSSDSAKSLKLKEHLAVSDVYHAAEIRDEHFANVYYKVRLSRAQLSILGMVAAFAVLAFLVVSPSVVNPNLDSPEILVSIVLFGIMGASVSGAITVTSFSLKVRIPERIVNWWVTATRLAVGATTALAVYAFLVSGLLNIGDLSRGLLLAVSFAAGFSERVILRAVETVAS